MRRLFVPSMIASIACAFLLAASVFMIRWDGFGQSATVAVAQGSVRVWVGHRGDHPGSAGLVLGGWSGGAMLWRPEFSAHEKVWVPAAASPGSGATMKQITGLSIIVPMYLPLGALLVLAGLSYPPHRRHRRMAAGLCGRCGYDTRGLKSRCPECGEAIRRVLALLRRIGTAVRAPLGTAGL